MHARHPTSPAPGPAGQAAQDNDPYVVAEGLRELEDAYPDEGRSTSSPDSGSGR
jgi:hypothetical protein